jgi:hypothetical protein
VSDVKGDTTSMRTPSDDWALVTAVLHRQGISPSASDLAVITEAYGALRSLVEVMRTMPATDPVQPAVSYRPGPVA